MKIITIDGPNGIGISSQARILGMNLKTTNKTVEVVRAKTIDELMTFLLNFKATTEFVILDGCGLNDISKTIIDSTLQTVPFQKYPNFMNIWIEFNLKNNIHNLVIIPQNSKKFSSERKIKNAFEFSEHSHAVQLLPTLLPHNGLKYTYITIQPEEKILQVYKKVILSDNDLGFLKYLE